MMKKQNGSPVEEHRATDSSTIENNSASRRRLFKRTSSVAPIFYIGLQFFTVSLLLMNSPKLLSLNSSVSVAFVLFSSLTILLYFVTACKNPGYLANSADRSNILPTTAQFTGPAVATETENTRKQTTPRKVHSRKHSVLMRGMLHSRKERSRSPLEFASRHHALREATNASYLSGGESDAANISRLKVQRFVETAKKNQKDL